MARKVVLVSDPGIDGAFALALAMLDPELDVLGVAATAGNVSSEQATRNVQTIVEQVDPPKWPRIGTSLAVEYDVDGRALHGPNGLGGVTFPCAQLHHPHASDKLLSDLVRQYPRELTIVVLGPLTVVARAMDRDPDVATMIHRLVVMGGSWHEPGNVTPVSEFHFYCDPPAARQVLRSGVPLTLIPLDVTRKFVLAPSDLLELPAPESRTTRFLQQITPYGIGATSNQYGIEGFHLKDVLGVAAVSLPGMLSTRHVSIDVEIRGELTRGMSVVDVRPQSKARPNVDLAVGADLEAARNYLRQTLAKAT